MLNKWPLLFIIIPIIEIFLLIEVGSRIGALWTVMLVISTAVIGVNLLRYQGLSTLSRAQKSMSQGTMPAMEMMEGLCLAVGGALLITPGFLTDTIGFICLIPAARRALIRYIMANATMKMGGVHINQGFYSSAHGHSTDSQPSRPQPPYSQAEDANKHVSSGRTFEGEYTKKEDS